MLSNKKILITGASSGIGRATAILCAKEGAKVFALGRDSAALESLKMEINCGTLEIDLTVENACQDAVEKANEYLQGLTTLINCAGTVKGGAFGTDACNLSNYKDNFNINTQATFEMMNESIKFLREQPIEANASILNVSSITGLQSFGGIANYCASKAAVDMYTRCAAVDLAPLGIRVNAVNPGVVITPLHKRGGMSDAAYEKFIQHSIETTHPLAKALGRLAEPKEVAELIAFLVGDKAKFITGDCIKIDGGRGCVGSR